MVFFSSCNFLKIIFYSFFPFFIQGKENLKFSTKKKNNLRPPCFVTWIFKKKDLIIFLESASFFYLCFKIRKEDRGNFIYY